jgi:hypothetical protein
MKLYGTLASALLLLLFLTPVLSQEAIEKSTEQAVQPEPSIEPDILAEPEQSGGRSESKKKETSAKQEQSVTALQDSMTAREFKAAGLEKLSAEELKNLNDWLQGYRKKAETKASEKATAEATKKAATQARPKIDQVDSRVDGTIDWLTGHSIIKLEDGTSWKQANKDDHFRAQVTDHPTAHVTHGTFGWKMRISGLPEFYVDPVR